MSAYVMESNGLFLNMQVVLRCFSLDSDWIKSKESSINFTELLYDLCYFRCSDAFDLLNRGLFTCQNYGCSSRSQQNIADEAALW